MAVAVKTGVFAMNTGTGNQAVTGLGFQPSAIMFYAVPHATADAANSPDAKLMIGAATSSSARWAHCTLDVDNVGSGDAQTRFTSGKCLLSINNSGAVLWAADFVSFDADGFTINVTTAPASAFRVYYQAYGGLTGATAGTFTLPTSGASVAVTGVGFRGDALLVGYGANAVDTAESHAKFGFGVAGKDLTQSCYTTTGTDLVGTSQKARAAQSAKLIYAINPSTDAVDAVATLGSFDADGFTVSITDNPATAIQVGYLALNGVSAKVVNDTAKTTTGTKATTGVGFQPTALVAFMVRSASAVQAAGGASTHNSLGSSSGSTAHGVIYALSIDAASTEDTASFNDDSYLVQAFSSTTFATPLCRAAVSSFDADGFTLDYATGDTLPPVLYFLALGQPVAEVFTATASLTAAASIATVDQKELMRSATVTAAATIATAAVINTSVIIDRSAALTAAASITTGGLATAPPRGVSIGFDATVSDAYPEWTRIA